MVLLTSRPYWAEPRAADATGPTRRDWWFVGVVVAVAMIEAVARDQIVWRWASLAVTVAVACLLPWRRVHPLLVLVLAFGTLSAGHALALVRDVTWDGLFVTLFALVLPYSLTRWGSGRDVGLGVLVLSVPLILTAAAGAPAGER